jgi:anti-sigma B factor antagonist
LQRAPPETGVKPETGKSTCNLKSFEVNLRGGSEKVRGGRMSLAIKTRKVDGVVVVDLSGRLTIGEAVQSMRQVIRSAVDAGDVRFVLNLGDVSYIDSSGLGELVSTYTTIRNRQGDVKLLHLTKKAQDLLQMTKLLTVFDTYTDEAMAISAAKQS